MARWFEWLVRRKRPAYQIVEEPEAPRLIIARSCYDGLIAALRPATARRHEGVALLLGRGDAAVKIALHTVRPVATTSAGSFQISAVEMARVIAVASRLDLEIVAQVHTHPGEAYHSQGDEEGARIRYDGYISLVIPDYGVRLPRLDQAAVYSFSSVLGWQQMPLDAVQIVEPGTAL